MGIATRTASLGVVAVLALGLVEGSALAALPFAPVIKKGPYLQELGATSTVVRLEIDPPAAVTVEVTGAQKGRLIASDAPSAFHSVRIDGLRPATRYTYRVKVAGASATDAAAGPEGTFTTAPSPDSGVPFSFLVYGDERTGEEAHAAVVRALTSTPADLLVNTGDFVQNGSDGGEWQSFFEIEGALLRDRCLFACVGNHELLEPLGVSFVRYFGPSATAGGAHAAADAEVDPEARLYHSFRWSNARFFLLNGMDTWTSGDEKAWLESELSRADSEPGLAWRFVVLHYGPWSSGPHGSNERLLAAGIVPILAHHKTDLVLSGHDHIYERGEQDGLRYVLSGGGGAPLYRVVAPTPSTRKAEAAYHFVQISVTPEAVRISAMRLDGSVLERCGFTKTSSWDCDPKKESVTNASDAKTAARSDGSRCGCRIVGGSSPGSPPERALLVAVVLGLAVAHRLRSRCGFLLARREG